MNKKTMLGQNMRRLRRDLGLTQAQMADKLGISPSYFNLIENNQRSLTVSLLLKIGQVFDVDIQTFAQNGAARVVNELDEVFSDPLFAHLTVKKPEIREVAASAPVLAQAIVTLYQAYRDSHGALHDLAEHLAERDKTNLLRAKAFPLDEVLDFFHAAANHFPGLEAAAEDVLASLAEGELESGLIRRLESAHAVTVRISGPESLGMAARRFLPEERLLLLSQALSPRARRFHMAAKIGILEYGQVLDRIMEEGGLASDEARRIARLSLANYFAAAMLMPYDRFLEAARRVRYDIEILQQVFDVSFEQVCHRLTTLQRTGARGVPFFMIRVDKAGNVSKRFTATGLQFARFGGTCPRWNVYDAFRMPGDTHTQLACMPDGATYFSIARTVTKAGGGFRKPAQQFAIGLSCDAAHAHHLVYADGFDLSNPDAATPIGTNCRLCDRPDCSQRAFPPLHHTLVHDENWRGLSPFLFPVTAKGP